MSQDYSQKTGGSKSTQFKPGQSGNPGGTPRGKRISTWMMEIGQMDELPDASSLPINGQIALARIKRAKTDKGLGDTEQILNRTEGSVPNKNEITGKDGESLASIISICLQEGRKDGIIPHVESGEKCE